MLRNLGAPIHCFGQPLRALFPEVVVNNHDSERTEFGTIEIRYTSRPSDLWGHPATEGTSCKRSHALARAPLLKFENKIPKKNKNGPEKKK
jgi:hypothetical protein